jgi:hypothetical protein
MDNLKATQNTDVESNDSETDSAENFSIRESLTRAFSNEDEAKRVNDPGANEPVKEDDDEAEEETSAPVAAQTEPERIPLAPPADMNAMEKEAFLNPTPANAHVLQQYMNRRAYETRSDYQRRMQEVEELRKQTAGFYDTIKQYEGEYIKDKINISDVAKRSIEWDVSMQKAPVETALDWLDSYGLTLEQLAAYKNGQQYNNGYQQPQQGYSYLTREEAERIAEEKLQAKLGEIEQQRTQEAVAYYNERVVESFTAAKPLFKDPETASQLEAEMAPIVQALAGTGKYSSPEEILETAYNYVVAGNPTFSSLHKAMTAKPMIEQQAAEAKKAQAASTSISGSAGSGTPRLQVKDLRDNLRRRMSGE